MNSLKFLATNFVEPGSCYSESLSSNIHLGISPGNQTKFSKKMDPNEDSCAAFICEDWMGAIVADAHWGKDSGEIIINFILEYLSENTFPSQEKELEKLFSEANQKIFDELQSGGIHLTSESSLLFAGINTKTKRYVFSSYGDSYAYLHTESSLKDLSTPLRSWMGIGTHLASIEFSQTTEIERSLDIPREAAQLFGLLSCQRIPIAKGIQVQESTLNSGDILMLCSDGLVEPIYGVQTIQREELEKIFHQNQLDLPKIGEVLLKEALRQDRKYHSDEDRGGEDNISFILLQCP